MKKTFLGLFTVFCVLNFSTCFSPWEGDRSEGSLTITIGGSARSLFYDADKGDGNNFSHAVSLRDAAGKITGHSFSGKSATIRVPPGTYTVTAKGFSVGENKEQTLRSYGTEGVKVISGKSTSVSIKMYSAVEVDGESWSDLSSLDSNTNSGRRLYVFLNENITIKEPNSTVKLKNEVDVTLITEAEGPVGITWNTTGSMFEVSGGAALRLGVEGTAGTITLTGSSNNTTPLINVGNGGTLVMYDGISIRGNNNTIGSGGGVGVTGGIFRIVTGTIYGSNEDVPTLRNTANAGGALHRDSGTVQYGTFSGDQWNNNGSLNTTNGTIEVVNGVLIRGGDIAVTGVTLESELSLTVGGEPGTLTATVAPSDASNKNVTWESSDDSVATVASGKVTAFSGGSATITVTTADGGFSASCTVKVQLPDLTGTVSITGNAEVGKILTADTANLGGTGTIAYQWERNSASGGKSTVGTDSNTYTVEDSDIGSTITVTVRRSGYLGSVTSDPTGHVTDPSLPPLTGTVSITGTPEAGQTLTANTASLGGTGTIAYEWKRGTTPVGTDSSTYIVQAADAGSTITVTVTRIGNSGSVTSSPTATVTLPELTGKVSINGHAVVGYKLTANTPSLNVSGSFTYQWNRISASGETTTNIGANSDTYMVKAADVDHYITVTVTHSGYDGSQTSDPTEAVIEPFFSITLPEISDGAPKIDGPTLSLSGADGLPRWVTLTIDNPNNQYTNIRWYGTDFSVIGETFILDAMNFANVGEHFLTLEVWKDGVPYSITVIFTIVP